MGDRLKISNVNSYSSFSFSFLFFYNFYTFSLSSPIVGYLFLASSWLRLVFWKSIHLEVASDSFCFLINSSWLLVFVLYVFSLFFSGFNLYCWRGIHFSWNNFLIFLVVFSNLLFSFHFWFRDLLRELAKKYEILLMVLFLLFFYFLLLKVCYLYPSFGHLFIHYLLQL